MRREVARDRDAFDGEIVALLPRLRRYAGSLTRSDPDRADDLVQGTVARALLKRDKFAAGTDLRAWLFTLMHHLNVTEVRAAVRRSKEIPLADIEGLVDEIGPSANLLVRDVARALARLPPRQRKVILAIAGGMSYEDVMRSEELPIGTVRSRLFRGRQALRGLMFAAGSGAPPPAFRYPARPLAR